MTAEEIRVAALARNAELGLAVPATRSVAYRRIGARTQQLAVRITELDPEYFGHADRVLVPAAAEDWPIALADVLDTAAERVYHVEIADPGESTYAELRRVDLVAPGDITAGVAPRLMLRDYELHPVEDDMAGVAAIRVYYARRAPEVAAELDVPVIPAQFHEILVVDLAGSMARKALGAPAELRDAVIALLAAEEAELMADLASHVQRFAEARTRRFR